MNVDSSMCASSGRAAHWEQIDWAKCERQVGRLQARIVKATRAGRWGKVKTLQRLLTHSFSGKALAVKRVTENQGRRTPGVDSVSWTSPAARLRAIGSLQRRGYKPLPFPRCLYDTCLQPPDLTFTLGPVDLFPVRRLA